MSRLQPRRQRLLPKLTIAALATLALALGSEVRAAGDGEELHDYVGVAKCRSCHKKELIGNQHATWQRGPHRKAFDSLNSEQSAEIARAQGLATKASHSVACLRCHATTATVSPHLMAYPLRPQDGVQCEACHGPGRDYRKKQIMSDPEKARAKGLWKADDPALCRQCHNEQSPTFDPNRYLLPDGTRVGFDYAQAAERIAHPIPEEVKGRYLELDEARKQAERAAGR